jgi:hypothetical protein
LPASHQLIDSGLNAVAVLWLSKLVLMGIALLASYIKMLCIELWCVAVSSSPESVDIDAFSACREMAPSLITVVYAGVIARGADTIPHCIISSLMTHIYLQAVVLTIQVLSINASMPCAVRDHLESAFIPHSR